MRSRAKPESALTWTPRSGAPSRIPTAGERTSVPSCGDSRVSTRAMSFSNMAEGLLGSPLREHFEVVHRPDARVLHSPVADALIAGLDQHLEVGAQVVHRDDLVGVLLAGGAVGVHVLGNAVLGRLHPRLHAGPL